MKVHGFARGLILSGLIGAWVVGTAEARNPHCAGGIQYVVQAMRDKDKGNLEDYQREINKAVLQLQQCSTEDPADGEAIGYLGWAYCEVDSPGPAARAFDASIKALQAKGDVKKVEWVITNRNSYWARWYNEGITKIQDAQKIYPDFCKKAEGDEAKLKEEAEKAYQAAEASLTKAALLSPNDPRSARNLASVYAFRCDYPKAQAILEKALVTSPNDSSLTDALRSVKLNLAGKAANEQNFDAAIATYTEETKRTPSNPDNWISLASAQFNKATASKDEKEKAAIFKQAGDSYGKASELKPTEADLAFNAALAYQNGKDLDKSATFWDKAVKLKPEDTDAKSAYAAVLVELNRCNDAIQTLHAAVVAKPQEQTLHRQLGAIYNKCGNSGKGTEEFMIFLTLSKGKAAADAAAAAKAAKQGSDAAKTLATEGVPEQVVQWEADQQKWETWFYWAKKKAYHFSSGGSLSQKSDWTQPVLAASSGPKK